MTNDEALTELCNRLLGPPVHIIIPNHNMLVEALKPLSNWQLNGSEKPDDIIAIQGTHRITVQDVMVAKAILERFSE